MNNSNNNNNATPKKDPSPTMIYVSNLPFTTKDEELRELFKDFEIKTAYVATRRNGRSKGFGFVNLAKEGEQTKAIEKVDGKEFAGRKITAKIAFNDERRNEKGELKEQFKKQIPAKQEGPPSETVVYVSNLPWSYKDEDLKKFFGELDVKNAIVAVRRSGKSKGFGFVEFATNEDQKKALAFDQKKIDERVISVKVSVNYRGADKQPKFTGGSTGGNFGGGYNNRSRGGSRGRGGNFSGGYNRGGSRGGGSRGGGRGGGYSNRGRSNNNNNNNNSNNNNNERNNSNNRSGPVVTKPARNNENSLYVSNLPFDLDDSDLKQIFSEFNVKNAHVASRPNGRSLGFGFVEFNNNQDQRKALEGLDQSEVNGRLITVKIATGPRRGNTGGGGFGGRRNNNNNYNNNPRRNNSTEKREPSSTMVYVSNLPFSYNDKDLSGVFTGFKVSNAYVATRKNGRSKGFGFVDFASSEDQQKALKLQGQEVQGRPLTIQVANKVEAKQTEQK